MPKTTETSDKLTVSLANLDAVFEQPKRTQEPVATHKFGGEADFFGKSAGGKGGFDGFDTLKPAPKPQPAPVHHQPEPARPVAFTYPKKKAPVEDVDLLGVDVKEKPPAPKAAQNIDLLDLSGGQAQPQPMGIPANPYATGFVHPQAAYGHVYGAVPGMAVPGYPGMPGPGFAGQPRLDSQLLTSTQ